METPEDVARRTARVSQDLRAGCELGRCVDVSTDALTRATFRPGDRVRDTVTGLEVTVVHSRFVLAVVPPSDR